MAVHVCNNAIYTFIDKSIEQFRIIKIFQHVFFLFIFEISVENSLYNINLPLFITSLKF